MSRLVIVLNLNCNGIGFAKVVTVSYFELITQIKNGSVENSLGKDKHIISSNKQLACKIAIIII